MGVEFNGGLLVTYEYDSQSRLVQRIEGATTTNYTWLGWSLIKETKSGAIMETTNHMLPADAFERGGEWFYLHGDALSSTQLVTDESGDQVARFIYGAWGEELYASESVPGILENRFVGGLGCRKDAATGLIYMRHRWYDPALQRFISRDPIGITGGLNLYAYSKNRPVTYVDPMGLEGGGTSDGGGDFPGKRPRKAMLCEPEDLNCSGKRDTCMQITQLTYDAIMEKVEIGEMGAEVAWKVGQEVVAAGLEASAKLMRTQAALYWEGWAFNCLACYRICLTGKDLCALGWLPVSMKEYPYAHFSNWPQED